MLITLMFACLNDPGSGTPTDGCVASGVTVSSSDTTTGVSADATISWLQEHPPTSLLWDSDGLSLGSEIDFTVTMLDDPRLVQISPDSSCPAVEQLLELPVTISVSMVDGEFAATGVRNVFVERLEADSIYFLWTPEYRSLDVIATGATRTDVEDWLTTEGRPTSGYQLSLWLSGVWERAIVDVSIEDEQGLSSLGQGQWSL